jgi:hypothetical protein
VPSKNTYRVIRYARPDEQPVGRNPILYVDIATSLTRAQAKKQAAALTASTQVEHFFAKV